MHTIENPVVPFCYPINGGLQCDAEIVVHGAVFSGPCKSFSVEYKTPNDTALHFNPRFKHFSEHTIVLNTHCHGQWQTEERHKNRLHVGDTFRLRIVNHHKHFLIELNDHHVCHFHHRIPVEAITHLEIKGDVCVQRVHFINFDNCGSAPPPLISASISPYPSLPAVQQVNYQPPPPAYSPYPNSGGSSPYPNTGGSPYPNTGSSPYPTIPPPMSSYPAPTSYVPGGISYVSTAPVESTTYVKSCGCATEHCCHGTHWDPHHHHHDSHHHHHDHHFGHHHHDHHHHH